MKKTINLFGAIAFAALIVFTMTAASCGGSKPYVSKTDDDTAYTLAVMNNKGKASTNPPGRRCL